MRSWLPNVTSNILRCAQSPGILRTFHYENLRHRSVSTAPQNEKPYYITTPIFYVNAGIAKKPGFKMTLLGQQCPLPFSADGRSLRPPKLMLKERGYIYQSKHEGWYSVSDETFCPPSAVHLILDPSTGRKLMASQETGKEVEWTSENNYHFCMSNLRDRLLQFYADNPHFVEPSTRMQDVVQQATSGLSDLSISRPVERLSWGIPVPDDPSQTIYVWLDALINYLTKANYPFQIPGQEHAAGWPADVHVIGKDIVRFHCIYWPAFLLALDLPLPKQVLTHAHWTLGREKMAKSTGNVVNPFFALERFDTDTMRYYLVRDGGIKDDSDYDNTFIISRYKSLQGSLGNLVTRIVRGHGWSVQRAVQYGRFGEDTEAQSLLENLTKLPSEVETYMSELHPGKAIQQILQIIDQ
ncbi:MAG: hypothetical protein Q9222_007584, partial [Ikaeria aurantiellina]